MLVSDLSVLIDNIELLHGIEKILEIGNALRLVTRRCSRDRVRNVVELSVHASRIELFLDELFDERF